MHVINTYIKIPDKTLKIEIFLNYSKNIKICRSLVTKK